MNQTAFRDKEGHGWTIHLGVGNHGMLAGKLRLGLGSVTGNQELRQAVVKGTDPGQNLRKLDSDDPGQGGKVSKMRDRRQSRWDCREQEKM